MFEKEIKFIIDFTLNRIKKLGSLFTFEKLAAVEIHPAIILYISNKLDYLIYEDRKNLLQNSSFDYSGSEISKYFNLIGEEIKKNKRLAFEDIKTLVSHAVTFNINYLVRPGWTLSKLIFDENKTRNVNEIKMMLNYLYFYDYIRNVFLGYFSKRKILSLNENDFGLILNKIDKQMMSEHTQDLIDNALVSISDFFNEGGLNKTRISTQTIEVFLKEKNLMEALFKLRRSIPAEDKGKYDIEDIRRILYSKEPVKIKHEKEEDTIEEMVSEEEVAGLEAPEEISEEEVPEEGVPEEGVPEEEVHEEETPEEIIPEQEDIIVGEEQGEINLVEVDVNSETQIEPVEDKEASGTEAELSKDEIAFEEPEWEDEEEIQDEEEKIIKENIPSDVSIYEEEKSKVKAEDDFLTRYESELKSLEELEAQLNNLDNEDVSFENLDEAVKKGVFEIEDDTDEPEIEETLSFEDIMAGEEEEDNVIESEENINEPENEESLTVEETKPDEERNEKDKIETRVKEKEKLRKEKEVTVEERNAEEDVSDELIIEEEEVNPFGENKKKPVEDSPEPGKNKDILSFLTDKEMDKIVSNVFNDDEEDFVNTMEKISDSATYDEATEILKTVFFSYKVSPFSRDAVTMTNAVSNFFNQE